MATPATASAPVPAQATDLAADPICEAVADPLADLATHPLHHADPEPRAVPGARGSGTGRHTRGWHWPGAARPTPRAASAAPPAPRTRDSYYTFTCTPIQVAPPLAVTSHPDTAPDPAAAAIPTPHGAPVPTPHTTPEAHRTPEAHTGTEPHRHRSRARQPHACGPQHHRRPDEPVPGGAQRRRPGGT